MSMNHFYITLFIVSILLSTSACISIENKYTVLPPGKWRATLELEPRDVPVPSGNREKDKIYQSVEEVTQGELPFNFELVYDDDTTFHLEIINGPERIRVDDIITWHDRATNDDSIQINFPVYGTYIRAGFEDDKIDGNWYVPYKGDNYRIRFRAYHGQGERFTNLKKKPMTDLTGKWETTFGEEDNTYKAIGEFQQDGNLLTGTFRTETGDYRYLEGTIQDKKAYLSCFDGSHAFLFEAKMMEDSSLIGSFRSGSHYKTIWKAIRNNNYDLGNADSLTFLKEGYDKIEFAFPNTNGDTIRLTDSKYQNKVKIVQILGTWCPNCRDETDFLVKYLKENPSNDLEVVAIAYERYRENEKAFKALNNYKANYDMNYELLLGGYYNKKEAAETLPMLNHILSYPTMIFIDRDNEVRRIHTGFSGPATSTFKDFEKDFEKYVSALLAEKNQLN